MKLAHLASIVSLAVVLPAAAAHFAQGATLGVTSTGSTVSTVGTTLTNSGAATAIASPNPNLYVRAVMTPSATPPAWVYNLVAGTWSVTFNGASATIYTRDTASSAETAIAYGVTNVEIVAPSSIASDPVFVAQLRACGDQYATMGSQANTLLVGHETFSAVTANWDSGASWSYSAEPQMTAKLVGLNSAAVSLSGGTAVITVTPSALASFLCLGFNGE